MHKIILLIITSFFFSTLQAQNPQGVIVSDTGNITVIKVWGNHFERGYASGYLLADKIKDVYENYIIPSFGSSLAFAKNIVSTNNHLRIDSIYVDEAKGMIQGISDAGIIMANVDYLDILVANTFLDLANLGSKFSGINMQNGCSSLISWGNATTNTSLNGKSVLSRHLDWTTNYNLINNQVIVVHFPDEVDEQEWLLIGFAGQISVLSGLNESGVGVMQHMLSDVSAGGNLNMSYEPIWFSLRKAIESADYNQDGLDNVNDVRGIIESNTQGYAENYIVTAIAPASCGHDSLIALVAEVSPANPKISFRYNSYPDSIPGKNVYAANYAIVRNDAMHFCNRYNAVRANMQNGIGISDTINWQIMRDYSSSCAFGANGNIQFMQFIPENKMLKLAVHKSNGSQACETDSTVYDLNTLFQLPLSAKENRFSDEISIYPNPFNDYISVNFGNLRLENLKITIYSIDGKKVYSNSIIKTTNLNIKLENKGMYILSVETGGNLLYTNKIMHL
jgi:hypothetical protein